MRIGKVKKITTRPDVIPVKLPKPKKTPIRVDNWPAKKPEPVPRLTLPYAHVPATRAGWTSQTLTN